MSDRRAPQMLSVLVGAACTVIVMWGARQAAHLLVILLIPYCSPFAFSHFQNGSCAVFRSQKI